MATSREEADHVGLELALAIRAGDLDSVERMLSANTELAAAPIRALKSRTPLMVVTDWPGYYPNAPRMVHLLAAAGADPNVNGKADQVGEKPLHWAASNDDLEVAEALLDIGAELEAPGSSIAGGAALENAVAFGCWQVARLLLARGAEVTHLWQAAGLGLTGLVEELLASTPRTREQITEAFWQACHGGQRRTAEFLLAQGADVDGHPPYDDQSPLTIAGAADTSRSLLVDWLKERGATSD
jgi:uncharacterized protein